MLTPKLLGGWVIEQPICYVGLVLVLGLLIRFLLSMLKAIEVVTEKPAISFCEECWSAFKGIGGNKDYWQPFVLGVIELGTFPVLIATEHWSFIGAWLSFKVVAQAARWKDERNVFSRFLIGTALGLLASFILANTVTVISK